MEWRRFQVAAERERAAAAEGAPAERSHSWLYVLNDLALNPKSRPNLAPVSRTILRRRQSQPKICHGHTHCTCITHSPCHCAANQSGEQTLLKQGRARFPTPKQASTGITHRNRGNGQQELLSFKLRRCRVAAETRANARGAQTAGDTALEFAARLGARPLATPTAQVQNYCVYHCVHTAKHVHIAKLMSHNNGNVSYPAAHH